MSVETIYTKHAPLFVVWACREAGVTDTLLAGTTEPRAIADEAGITDRAAERVLPALADLGYVERVDGEYHPTDRLEVLDADTPVLERGMLPHRLDILENYLRLPALMQGEEYPEFTERGLRNYIGGMASIGEPVVRGAVTVAEHAHPRPATVLDVGGGIGRFAREFESRGAAVTLLDEPPVIEVVRPHLQDTDIELVRGDAVESLPDGFDLAFCGRLTVSCTPAENEQLFGNLYDAVTPGGTVVCMDFVRDRSDIGPLFGAHMLALAPTGDTYTAEQYRSWLDGAGFVQPAIRDVPGTEFQAIIGHRPE